MIAIEERWIPVIQATTLYWYEFLTENFTLLDVVAGYYISYDETEPLTVIRIDNIPKEVEKRREIELRVLPGIQTLAARISRSTLNYSLIRMRNAMPVD